MYHIQNNQDKNRALDIMEKAFIGSTGMTWMLRRNNKSNLRIFLSFFFHEVSVKNGAWLTSDRNGVVFFYQLQNQKKSILNVFRKLYVFVFIMGFNKGAKAIHCKAIVDKIRPKTGWFGWLVATDDTAIGNAAAYEIKNEMFKMADESNESIYVETTVKRVMVLYKASGYYEYAKITHPYEKDLTIWFMKRDPHTFNK